MSKYGFPTELECQDRILNIKIGFFQVSGNVKIGF